MSQKLQTCNPQQFVGTQQFEIPIGTTIITLTRFPKMVGADWSMQLCGRPVVPLWGVKKNNVTGAYDFIPSTQANRQVLMDVAICALLASRNYYEHGTDAVGDVNIYDDSAIDATGQNYGSVLAKKVNSACKENRYYEVYNKMVQFFNLHAAIVAFDIALYKELTDQVSKVMRESDKQMYIPTGLYIFRTGSVANTSLEAWYAADNNLAAFFGIELIVT